MAKVESERATGIGTPCSQRRLWYVPDAAGRTEPIFEKPVADGATLSGVYLPVLAGDVGDEPVIIVLSDDLKASADVDVRNIPIEEISS